MPKNPAEIFTKALEILRDETPAPPSAPLQDAAPIAPSKSLQEAAEELQTIPARMLNEFVYCPRLFFYEFVEGVFVESADTLRGTAIHQRVDTGNGEMPATKSKVQGKQSRVANRTKAQDQGPAVEVPKSEETERGVAPASAKDETIHSRSVQMGSEK